MRYTALTSVVSTILLTVPALADGAPAGALNKTIMVSFTATGQAKSPEGEIRNFNTQISRIIYVSSAGRPFLRFRATNRGGSRGGEAGPDEQKGSISFQGDRLVDVVPFATGARQITITFDPGFSSCTASVIEGHSGGVIRRRGPNGTMFEITNATTSSMSCSIQSGNAFAG